MLLNRCINKAGRVLLRNNGIYRYSRTIAGGHLIHMSLEDARGMLQAACPYEPPELPGPREAWPDEPMVDVSIIVPCYSAEKYLDECLASILNQDTKYSIELIAVDDGSPDKTGSIIDGWADRDDRVVAVHQENRGFSGARNRGLEYVRGRTIMFVDSDDQLERDAVERLAPAVMSGSCDYVTSNYRTMGANGSNLKTLGRKRSHGAPWGRIYSREVWRNLCFPKGLWFEDTVQAYCVNGSWREQYVESFVYRYRQHGESITAKCSRSKKGADTYWVVEAMLEWCRSLDIKFDQRIFEQTLKQFGPLALSRSAALSSNELCAFFACCCELLRSVPEFETMSTEMGGRWEDIELALRTQDFGLWKLACRAV